MSNPYSDADIEVMSDWNAILERCGNCPMPGYFAPYNTFERIRVHSFCYASMPNYIDGVTEEDLCKRFKKIRKLEKFDTDYTVSYTGGSTSYSTHNTRTTLRTLVDTEDTFCSGTSINTNNRFNSISTTDEDPPEGESGLSFSSFSYVSSNASGSCIGTYTSVNDDDTVTSPWNVCGDLPDFSFDDFVYQGEGLFTYESEPDVNGGILRREIEYLDQFSFLEWLEEKLWEDEGQIIGIDTYSYLTCQSAQKVRYRWFASPVSVTDSYIRVIWDIIEEPDGWDDEEPTVSRSWVSRNNVWEWHGPGLIIEDESGYDYDPESLQSDWYYIDAPEVVGRRRIVNIRYDRGTTPYGSLPMVSGEGVELPD